ncbi:MAG TPA: peptide chain release factor N(5)-glutamine methyltransferase [Micromonosporaceae bacterium]|nr:peptide chain release factor N(5)-glutamine methyltransferase [Micromonosporaceae bacterium]
MPADHASRSAAIARAASVLREAGVAAPRVDAELLAAHVLGVPRGRLVLAGGLGGARLAAFERLVALRARRVPLQHLLGSAGFRRIELAVGPGVFIPRPETELLVDWGLGALRSLGAQPCVAAQPCVVDLCAGSGAIALAVAQEGPPSRVYAVERAPAAVEWLRRNAAERVAAGDRPVEVVAGDATDPAVLSTLDGRVDLVLCNPPYVPAGTRVPVEVGGHDPADAVFAGPDGLAVIRPVVSRVAALLRPGGRVGIEHDDSHGEAVPALLRADGRFDDIRDHSDLAGRPRFATARRRAPQEMAD